MQNCIQTTRKGQEKLLFDAFAYCDEQDTEEDGYSHDEECEIAECVWRLHLFLYYGVFRDLMMSVTLERGSIYK